MLFLFNTPKNVHDVQKKLFYILPGQFSDCAFTTRTSTFFCVTHKTTRGNREGICSFGFVTNISAPIWISELKKVGRLSRYIAQIWFYGNWFGELEMLLSDLIVAIYMVHVENIWGNTKNLGNIHSAYLFTNHIVQTQHNAFRWNEASHSSPKLWGLKLGFFQDVNWKYSWF